MDGDGGIIAIGAPFNDARGDDAGHVRVYQFDGIDWVQMGGDIDGDNAGDLFGYSVSLNHAGDVLGVGAPGLGSASAGQAYIFKWTGNEWVLAFRFDGTNTDDSFGYSVSLSIDGSSFAVGAPYYDLQNGSSQLQSQAIIEMHSAPQGQVTVWRDNGTSWNQLGSSIYGFSSDSELGYAVSMRSGGSLLMVGSPGAYSLGSVQVFELLISQEQVLDWHRRGDELIGVNANERFGSSLDVSAVGTILAVGAPSNGSGTARMYQWSDDSVWRQLGRDITGAAIGDAFGSSIALSSTGDVVAVGAPLNDNIKQGNGAVSVLQWNGGAWERKGDDIQGEGDFYYYAQGEAISDQFGSSVAISNSGDVLIAGAVNNDASGLYSGQVRSYAFALPSLPPTPAPSSIPTMKPTQSPSAAPTAGPKFQRQFKDPVLKVESDAVLVQDVVEWEPLSTNVTVPVPGKECVVYLLVNFNIGLDENGEGGFLTLFRNGTDNLGNSEVGMQQISGLGADSNVPATIAFIDAPGAAGNISYDLYGKSSSPASGFEISENGVVRQIAAIVGCAPDGSLGINAVDSTPLQILSPTLPVPSPDLGATDGLSIASVDDWIDTGLSVAVNVTFAGPRAEAVLLTAHLNAHCASSLGCLTSFTFFRNSSENLGNAAAGMLSIGSDRADSNLPVSLIFMDSVKRPETTSLLSPESSSLEVVYNLKVRPWFGDILLSKDEQIRQVSATALLGATLLDNILSTTKASDRLSFSSSEWRPLGMNVSVQARAAGNAIFLGATLSVFSRTDAPVALTIFRNGAVNLGAFDYGLQILNHTDRFAKTVMLTFVDTPQTTELLWYDVYIRIEAADVSVGSQTAASSSAGSDSLAALMRNSQVGEVRTSSAAQQGIEAAGYDTTLVHSLNTDDAAVVSGAGETRQLFAAVMAESDAEPVVRGGTSSDVPTITAIELTVGATNATVTVLFEQSAAIAGSIYCAAYRTDGINTTAEFPGVASVFRDGFEGFYKATAVSATAEVEFLSAVSSYTLYCVVRATSGAVSTAAEAQDTATDFQTQCCHTILLSEDTNELTVIRDDAEIYTQENADESEYVFSYSLSGLPATSVTVQHHLLYKDGTAVPADILQAIPPSVMFSSSGNLAAATGAFVINGTVQGSTDINIIFNATGPSGDDFQPMTKAVTVIRYQRDPPTPRFRSATLSSSGETMFFNFSTNTDRAARLLTSDSFNCGELFMFDAQSFTTCTWISSKVVKGTFDAYVPGQSVVSVGSAVSLIGGQIRAACSTGRDCSTYNATEEVTVVVLAPQHPPHPRMVISGAETVGPCQNVTLDFSETSGHGGRPFAQLLWFVYVQNDGNSSSAILSRLQAISNDILTFVVLPSSELEFTEYTLTAVATNIFNVTSSSSFRFTVSPNVLLPQLSIQGGADVTLTARDEVVVHSFGASSSCTEADSLTSSSRFTYAWFVYLDGQLQEDIVTLSNDPRVLKLAPYTLKPSLSYTVVSQVTVEPDSGSNSASPVSSTAHLILDIERGGVIAIIQGGARRTHSIDTPLQLDASFSVDEASDTSSSTSAYDDVANEGDEGADSALAFYWSCRIFSIAAFGSSCDDVFGSTSRNSSTLLVPAHVFQMGRSYLFEVLVTSQDGRSDVDSIVIVPEPPDAPLSAIYRPADIVFNADQTLNVTGTVQADYAIDCEWNAMVSSEEVSFPAFTPLMRNFTAKQASRGIQFPLLVAAHVFPGNARVLFRLTCSPTAPAPSGTDDAGTADVVSAYSQVTLHVNSPPTGGEVAVTPTAGLALSTQFFLQLIGFTDRVEDYPLRYAFGYYPATDDRQGVVFAVQQPQQRAFVTTQLPAGNQAAEAQLILVGTVFDIYGAASEDSTTAVVESAFGADAGDEAVVLNYLTSNLDMAFRTGDVDAAFQTVGAAAVTVNVVNCTLAPPSYCAQLNRSPCQGTPQTCSACLQGFDGVAGASNAKCFDTSDMDSGADLGESCITDADCLLGNCTSSVCEAPILQCQSNIAGEVCSGHGYCQYTDISNNILEEPCTVLDVSCRANCICDGTTDSESFSSGGNSSVHTVMYSGSACQLKGAEAVRTRDEERSTLCTGLAQSGRTSLSSTQLLRGLVRLLGASFNQAEAVSHNSTEACLDALQVVMSYAAEGFLRGDAADEISQGLAQSISEFVRPFESTEVSSYGDDDDGSNHSTTYYQIISDATGSLISSVLRAMVEGQFATSIVSSNLQVTTSRDLVDSLLNRTLTAPRSAEQQAYGPESPQSSVEFAGEDSVAACDAGAGYSSIGVMDWGVNPFPGSQDVQSAILRFAWQGNTADSRSSSGSSGDGNSEPAFYLKLAFNAEQNFDLSLTPEVVRENPELFPNVTFPECSIFDGDQFVPCSGCALSSYTNVDATFACYDIGLLCGGDASSTSTAQRRRMLSTRRRHNRYDDGEGGGWGGDGTTSSSTSSTTTSSTSSSSQRAPHASQLNIARQPGRVGLALPGGPGLKPRLHGRRLSTEPHYARYLQEEGDDDDAFSNEGSSNTAQFGAIFHGCG